MTSTKKKIKHLVKLRARQHRRLEATDYAITPIAQLDRDPDLKHPRRTERTLRASAERVLTDDARSYIKARRLRAQRAEASSVLQAIALANRHRGSRMLERGNAALGDVVPLPNNTDDIENSIELYASLVAAADWVADWSSTARGILD